MDTLYEVGPLEYVVMVERSSRESFCASHPYAISAYVVDDYTWPRYFPTKKYFLIRCAHLRLKGTAFRVHKYRRATGTWEACDYTSESFTDFLERI